MKLSSIRHAASYALLLICLTSPALGQLVRVKRIDARPPGHPLDTGSAFDPIMDDTFRAAHGNAGGGTAACVIRVPRWIPESEKAHPNAVYYMYYSTHHGTKIRMAWSASITGQWRPFNSGSGPDRAWGAGDYSGPRTPGEGVLDRELHGSAIVLDENTAIDGKLHFVDVYADDVNRRIIMYFHGVGNFVATSRYGLNFNMPEWGGERGQGPRNVRVTEWYLRSFELDGEADGQPVQARFGVGRSGFWKAPIFNVAGKMNTHANADEPGGWWTPGWPGDPTPEDPERTWTRKTWWTEFDDSANPMVGTVTAPELVNPERSFQFRAKHGVTKRGRHFAFYYNQHKDRNRIYVFKTNSRELPESVCLLVFDLTGLSETDRLDPSKWKRVHDVEEVLLKPNLYWEGIDRAYKPSNNGVGNGHHFRDPYVFEDIDGRLYLFYSGKGEANIGVAELTISPEPKDKSIRVTAPHAGHPIVVGNTYLIGWTSHGGIENVDLEYSADRTTWIPIASEVENRRYYAWTVPETVSNEAIVRIRESSGQTTAVSEAFTIAREKAIGIVSPRKETVYFGGGVHYPTYCGVGDMDYITFEYSVDGGPWIMITDQHSNKSKKRAEWNAPAFAWSVPEFNSESVRLRVSETGGSVSAVSEPFSIVTKPK